MKVRINKGVARGRIDAPPSKSMAHRLLICAGLSEGECTVHGISESEDVLATLDCLKAIGAKWKRDKDAITVTGRHQKNTCRKDTPMQRKRQHSQVFHTHMSRFRFQCGAFRKQKAYGKTPWHL